MDWLAGAVLRQVDPFVADYFACLDLATDSDCGKKDGYSIVGAGWQKLPAEREREDLHATISRTAEEKLVVE